MALHGFMDSALVTWVRMFSVNHDQVDFQDLVDGTYLHDVLYQVWQKEAEEVTLHREVKDNGARLQNWTLLLGGIRDYYQDVLQQIVVMELPNVLHLIREPRKEAGLQALTRTMQLLLGAAVQGPQKEDHVNDIKLLKLEQQEELVRHIKEVTDDARNVVSLDALRQENGDFGMKQLYGSLSAVARQRDSMQRLILQLTQERDFYRQEAECTRGPYTTPPGLEASLLARDLTAVRAQLSALQEEHEEKVRETCELQRECKDARNTVNKLKSENVTLSNEASAVHALRDDVHRLQQQLDERDQADLDALQLKQTADEVQLSRQRISELQDDLRLALESRDEAEDARKQLVVKVDELYARVARQREEQEALIEERREMLEKLTNQADEIAQLEINRDERGRGLTREISTDCLTASTAQIHLVGNPISEELKSSMTPRLTELEKENAELRQKLTDQSRADVTLREMQQEAAHLRDAADQETARRSEAERATRRERELRNQLERSARREREDLLRAEHTARAEREQRARAEDAARRDRNLRVLAEREAQEQRELRLDAERDLREEEFRRTETQQGAEALRRERAQLAQVVEQVRRCSESRINQLERDLAAMNSRARFLRQHSSAISDLCETDSASVCSLRSNGSGREPEVYGNAAALNCARGGGSLRSVIELDTQTAVVTNGNVVNDSRSMSPFSCVSDASTTSSDFHRIERCGAFVRNDKRRATIQSLRTAQPSPCPSPSVASPSRSLLRGIKNAFSRGDKLRASLPERGKRNSAAETPQNGAKTRQNQPNGGKSPYPPATNKDLFGGYSDSENSRPLSSDAGYTSQDSPDSAARLFDRTPTPTNRSPSDENQSQTRTRKSPEKIKTLVDKVVDLQNKNANLLAENRRLQKIVNAYESSHKSPYDRRQYHYYSNV